MLILILHPLILSTGISSLSSSFQHWSRSSWVTSSALCSVAGGSWASHYVRLWLLISWAIPFGFFPGSTRVPEVHAVIGWVCSVVFGWDYTNSLSRSCVTHLVVGLTGLLCSGNLSLVSCWLICCLLSDVL